MVRYPHTPLGHHPTALGHQLLADILASYLFQVDAELDFPRPIPTEDLDFNQIPTYGPYDAYGQHDANERYPHHCLSVVTDPPTLTLGKENEISGWTNGNWKTKKFIVAYDVGSVLTFHWQNEGESFVQIFHWVSPVIGFGKAECWVDNHQWHRLINGYWTLEGSVTWMTPLNDQPIAPGNHTLTCVVSDETDDHLGRHEFRISGIAY